VCVCVYVLLVLCVILKLLVLCVIHTHILKISNKKTHCARVYRVIFGIIFDTLSRFFRFLLKVSSISSNFHLLFLSSNSIRVIRFRMSPNVIFLGRHFLFCPFILLITSETKILCDIVCPINCILLTVFLIS